MLLHLDTAYLRIMFVSDNKTGTMRSYLLEGLEELYDQREAASIVGLMFEEFKGWNKADVQIHRDDNLTESELLKFHFALKRLRKGEPIQYVLGSTEFYGMQLEVGSGVLIPRPETEELVRMIVEDYSAEAPSIVDWCAGSGCISLALKKELPKAEVIGVEKSEDALSIANRNVEKTGLDVEMTRGDILSTDLWSPVEQIDVLVSNPPYVAERERSDMGSHVIDHEPGLALFVPDNDPLLFYRALAHWGLTHLKQDGMFYAEIDRNQHEEIISLLESLGYRDVQAFKDLNDNWRMIRAKR